MKFLSDEPSLQDKLDAKRFLDGLDEFVFSEDVTTPLTVGIYADWGTGKSSLLQQLKLRLDDKKEQFVCTEFSPWEYQHEQNLLIPLLLCLQKQTRARNVKEKIKKLALVTGYHVLRKTVLPAVKVATFGMADAEEVRKSGEEIEGELDRGKPDIDLSDIAKLRDLVHEVVVSLRGGKKSKKTLVILIDDLDRCHPPERIIDLLEQVKLFLTVPGCIFVLACDRKVIIEAIEAKFPGHGQQYLEKFVQVAVPLPNPSPQQLVQLIDESDSETSESDHEWENFLVHVGDCFQGNPRRFKRLLNRFNYGWKILKSDSDASITKFQLMKWLTIEELAPSYRNQPFDYLDLEADLQESAVSPPKSMSSSLWQFLVLTRRWQFNGIANVSTSIRFSSRYGNEGTRLEAEQRLVAGESMPETMVDWNLTGAFLPEVDLEGRNLCDTNFNGAHLAGANFSGADVENCFFGHADLTDTQWAGCNNILDITFAFDPERWQIDNLRFIMTIFLLQTAGLLEGWPERADNELSLPIDQRGISNFVPDMSIDSMADRFDNDMFPTLEEFAAKFRQAVGNEPSAEVTTSDPRVRKDIDCGFEQRVYWQKVASELLKRSKDA